MAIDYTVFRGTEGSGKIQEAHISHGDLKPEEVLVRIEYSGVCGTDEHMRHTNAALGHEGVGIVEKNGAAVSRVAV